jgi:simple sugar transport system permease protein
VASSETSSRPGLRLDPVLAGLSLLLVAVVAVFSLLVGDRFLSAANLQSIAFQLPELGVLALAMMITLVCGGLNLSVISTANCAALLMGWIMVQGGEIGRASCRERV